MSSFDSSSSVATEPPSAASSASATSAPVCCGGCGSEGNKTATGLKRCAGCSSIHYCSVNCQKSHWSFHKVICNVVKAVHGALSDRTKGLHERLRCLTEPSFRSNFTKNFPTILSLTESKIHALFVEDIEVHLKFDDDGDNKNPQTSFALYLLSTIFLKNPDDSSSNYLDINKLLLFLKIDRSSGTSSMEKLDPMSMLFTITKNILLFATDERFDERARIKLRDGMARPMLRHMHNILVSDKVCAFIFESPPRMESVVINLEVMIDAITDKDRFGLDPNSFLEGLVYGLTASFVIQLGRQHPEMKECVEERLKSHMHSGIYNDSLSSYLKMALPMQKQYIAANKKYNV